MRNGVLITILDATPRLFDPDIWLQDIRPAQWRTHSTWFRDSECLRLIYDELRDARQPVTTRDIAERITRAEAIPAIGDRGRELVQRTLLGSLNRPKQTIVRVEIAGVVSWRPI